MDISFYQAHLDRVSRSFAFCIQKLDAPYRGWVSLAYLLCRVLDTVEDSQWSDPKLRKAQYQELDNFIENLPSEEEVVAWAGRFPVSVTEGEKLLLADSYQLFADLHHLPANVRTPLQKAVQKMSDGMKDYAARAEEGTLRLFNLADVNRYCYFVAGLVGELLTELLAVFRPEFLPDSGSMENAVHFGLFLQKVNLLKDQRGDEEEGRYLVPSRSELLASLRENAEGALAYITSLPLYEKGYRIFCSWSFFLGAASLKWMDKGKKIPRSITKELLERIEAMATNNSALISTFNAYFPRQEWT